jgi:hypothetical protein
VDPVLERGAHLGERDPVAKQIAQVAKLARGDVGLGEQVGAQELRQGAGVDGVGLHPCRGDRLGSERMGEVELIARPLEDIGEPLPAVGRLQRDLRLALQLPKELQEGGGIVLDPPRDDLVALPVDGCEVRAAAMQVDTDRIHPWASFDPGFSLRPGHIASGTGALGGPLLHGIKSTLDGPPPICESSSRAPVTTS